MTINFELRNRPDKNGLCAIRIVIHQRGKRAYIPLAVRIPKSEWDIKTQKVKSSHSQSTVINNVLRLKMSELQAKVATQSMIGEPALEDIAGRKISKTSFVQFANMCLSRWEKTKAGNSIRAYQSMLRKVKEFQPSVSIEDITPDWLARYEHHCRDHCGDGGTLKRISFISVILKEAIRQSIIDRDPFLIYRKPPKKNPPKIWLTLAELDLIQSKAIEIDNLVLRKTSFWFLLACYTGLRYSDIETFNSKKVVQDGRLVLYTQKTGEVVSIKATSKIKQLISLAESAGPVPCNQLANKYLKTIASLAGIDKLVTFHTARHTFAVNCANLGISQEVAAKLLGHSDMKTTAIYYKIVNARVDKEMEKWEG